MIGPVVNDGARERIIELIEDARAKGAEVLSGGEADGNLIAPTVLAGVTPEMRIYGEESFGPVVSIVPVDGADEAVRVANDTEYGLVGRRVRRATSTPRWRSRAGSRAASATSTPPPCTTSRRCRSAASRRAAGGASAAAPRSRSSPSCAG